jgi:hypothetical protein
VRGGLLKALGDEFAIFSRSKSSTPVDAIKHKEARVNIPTRKIAVKVINHYGDEVLKVYEVSTVPA